MDSQDVKLLPCPLEANSALGTLASLQPSDHKKDIEYTSSLYILGKFVDFYTKNQRPAPREQELEAQNKALWELVGNAERTLHQWANPTEQFTDISEWSELVNQTLATIQKAKESK